MASNSALFVLLVLIAAWAPFGLGVLLASASGFPARGFVVAVAALAVAALTLAGLAGRAAYPPGPSRCPGLEGPDRERWQRLAYRGLGVAGVLAVLLQWVWRTGDFTIPLAGAGVLGGYFVFAPPLAWQRRGWGEFWGGLAFGLLPVATGFYLQARHLISEILLYGVPLSLTAFNLGLAAGLPQPEQQQPPEPPSLAARLGPVGTGLLYTIVNILIVLSLIINLFFPAAGHRSQPWLWGLIALAMVNQELVKRRAYYQEARIRLLCCLTLALYLGMCLIFALGLWSRL